LSITILALVPIFTSPAAELYYVLFDAITSGKNPTHGREGYYFIENGEYTLKQVCDAIAKSLHASGKADKDEPVDLTPEERQKYQWVCRVFNCCSQGRPDIFVEGNPLHRIKLSSSS
jgi:hypothetical protein